jgi:hypothetical protein
MSNSGADCDFLEHLRQTLDSDRDAALSLLGAWLVSYRPSRRYELNFLSARSSESPASPTRRAA